MTTPVSQPTTAQSLRALGMTTQPKKTRYGSHRGTTKNSENRISPEALLLKFLKLFESAHFSGMARLFAVNARYMMQGKGGEQLVWSGRRNIILKLQEIRERMPGRPKITAQITRRGACSASSRWELRCITGSPSDYENSGTLTVHADRGCITKTRENLDLRAVLNLVQSDRRSR